MNLWKWKIFLRQAPTTPLSSSVEAPSHSPPFTTTLSSSSSNLTASVTMAPCDPAACSVVSRLIIGYSTILSSSKDGNHN